MKEKQNNPSHSNVVVHLTPYQLEVIIRESSLYFFKRFSTDMVAGEVAPFYFLRFWNPRVAALYQVKSH